MRILFAGTPDVALPTLDALLEAGHDVVAVLTRADAPAGRGRKLTPSPVSTAASERGIPVLTPARVADVHDALTALDIDLAVVVAYGQLIRPAELAIPRHGWINLHFSLLPRWRGAAPVQRAIMTGDRTTGSAVFQLVPELDAGPVFSLQHEPLLSQDTSAAVLTRLSHSGAQQVIEVVSAIGAGAVPTPQPTEGMTLAPKITVEDAHLDFGRPAEELDRLIRGTHPAPGAWTDFRGERFKVVTARPDPSRDPLAPGRLEASRAGLFVGTATHPLRLDRVKAFGKKEMGGADWARGANLTADDTLGDEA